MRPDSNGASPWSAPQRVGERRQVTALFYDIVNSTALLHRIDPEDFGLLQRRIHTEAASVIAEFGGHLDVKLGDGGCAYFGYPVPAEDAAECALSAALELIERCRSITGPVPTGRPLSLRVGLATSVVILSGKPGAVPLGGDDIVGLAPTLAARIQGEAEPNSVLVADATYQLTRLAFEFEAVGERPLKGFDAPQALWRAVVKRSVEDRFSAVRRAETPLIARSDELALCRRRWLRARGGRGQMIFVSGEAGIGKSRLVAALRNEAKASVCDARVFQCQPRGNMQPLHPLLDRLRREIRDRGGSPDDLRAVRGFLAESAADLGPDALEMIAYLLGTPGDAAVRSSLADLPADEFRSRAIATALGVISAWSRVRPQLIVIEDLHWADTLTEGLVAALAEEVEHLSALILVTTRGRPSEPIAGDPHLLSLSLSRLDERAVPQLVAAIWRPRPPPAGLAAFVQEKSDGVPLFVEELTHLLMGRIDLACDTRVVDWERVLSEDGIVTLKDLLAARLAGLGEARRVAQIASVIGREFSRDLLLRVAHEEGIDGDRLDELLDQLAFSNIVRPRQAHRPKTFRFHHVLIQEAVYENLLKSERRHLHGRIVDAARDAAVTDLPDEVLSWHCGQAGRLVDATAYAVRAAEACATRSAMQEAWALLEAAERDLAACSPGPIDLTLQLLMTKGSVATSLYGKGSVSAGDAYTQGVALCRTMGDQSRERFFPLYWGWWFTAPNFGTQQMRSRILLKDLETAPDPEVRLQSLHCAWATHFHTGQHAECLHCVREGLRLYDPVRATSSRVKYGGHDAQSCALGERGLSLWFLGDDEGAVRSVKAAVEWGQATQHLGSFSHALEYAVTLARYRSDFGSIVDLAQKLADIGESRAMPGLRAKAKMFGGWARALTTSAEAGLREFQEGLAIQRDIGTEENRSIHLDMESELLAATGNVEAGIAVLNEAIGTFERAGQVFWVPELYRRRARLRHALGESREGCLEDLRRSLALSAEQGAITLAARAHADLDRMQAGAIPPR